MIKANEAKDISDKAIEILAEKLINSWSLEESIIKASKKGMYSITIKVPFKGSGITRDKEGFVLKKIENFLLDMNYDCKFFNTGEWNVTISWDD